MMLRNKRLFSVILSLVLVLGVVFGGLPANAAETQKLVILHVNDVHGRIVADSREGGMGFGVFKTKLDELRKENENLLLLNAGDALHGTTMINLTDGEAMVELMNYLKFDALTPGNHDFNYGYEKLLELEKMAEFPIIAANVVKEADKSQVFDPYVIKEFDGFKVGIFGLATPETKYKSHPNNTIGVEFENPVDAAKKMVAELEGKGVDVIVALAHLGIAGTIDVTSKEVAEQVKGIDIIIDGHSHEELNQMVGDTLLVQAGYYMRNIGRIELEIADGKVVKAEEKMIPTAELEGVVPNEEIEGMVKEIEEANKAFLDVEVGTAKVELYGGREEGASVRADETILGNLIADVMRWSTGADAAFANGGGIRASIPKGVVKVDDIIKAFPFTNTLAVIEVTGQELIDALENGVSVYPEELGGFPQVSGLKFEFDPSKPAGQRVTSVRIGEKLRKLSPTRVYTLVTNDFMASGGDGYVMFDNKPFVAEGGLLSDVLIDYFKEVGEVEAKLEGRITALEVKDEVPEVVPPVEPPVVEPPVAGGKYVVVAGDVLWKIAQKFGTTWEKLAEFNKLANPNLIFPDQVILIP